MTELTRDDLAAIRSALGERYPIDERDQAIYRAGLSAGIERSAKVVEGGRFLTDTAPIKLWADECAAAIRALLHPPA